MPRMARSTPGMNETRSMESCLMVSTSPGAPSRTSWWATRPASRMEWTWTPPPRAEPLAPSTADTVASGGSPSPAAALASAIIAAVRDAVPEGASALAAWCSSITSAEVKNRAACWANRIISTAPTEKLGTTSTRTPGAAASHARTCASRDSSNPEVPTTVSRPLPTHQRRLSMTAPGWVKSTTTSHPASVSRGSPSSTSAAMPMPSAPATAWHTCEPIRPRAPSTPTLIMTACHSPGGGEGPAGVSAQCGGEGCVVVERAHHGEHLGPSQDFRGHLAHVVVGDRLDGSEDLVHGFEPGVHQFRLAEAAHPGGRVLQAEDERPAQLALAPVKLGLGQPAGDDLGDLLLADRQHLVSLGRQAPDVGGPHAGVGMLRGEAVDRVGQPALLPHFLEQPRGHAAAQGRVEHPEREPVVIGAGQASAPEHQVGLLDGARHQAHAGPGREAVVRVGAASPVMAAPNASRTCRVTTSWSTLPATATTRSRGVYLAA